MPFITFTELSSDRRPVHFRVGPDEDWDEDRHRTSFRVSPGDGPGLTVLDEVFSNGHTERYMLMEDARGVFILLCPLGVGSVRQGGFDTYWFGPDGEGLR